MKNYIKSHFTRLHRHEDLLKYNQHKNCSCNDNFLYENIKRLNLQANCNVYCLLSFFESL